MSTFKQLLLAAALGAATLVNAAEPLNINTASAQALAAAIIGVGESRAAKIVAYRDQYGPFRSVDDLVLVSGIGQGIVDRSRDKLTAQDAK